MKIKLLLTILMTFLLIISVILYFSLRYKSAFEADKQCHFELSKSFADSEQFGCDHDLETRQWILFKDDNSFQPAQVIKRFRY